MWNTTGSGPEPCTSLCGESGRCGTSRRVWPTGRRGAFLVDRALGWGLVPPTVVRSDLPFGVGSLQLFVPARFEHHYFTLASDERLRSQLERICVLDVVINNTDRKSGHCLLGVDGAVWAIDNGLSFHHDFKLRTVIWDFAGDELPPGVRRDLRALLDGGLPEPLAHALDDLERDAVLERTQELLRASRFPDCPHGRCWPWPLV